MTYRLLSLVCFEFPVATILTMETATETNVPTSIDDTMARSKITSGSTDLQIQVRVTEQAVRNAAIVPHG